MSCQRLSSFWRERPRLDALDAGFSSFRSPLRLPGQSPELDCASGEKTAADSANPEYGTTVADTVGLRAQLWASRPTAGDSLMECPQSARRA